MKRITLSLLALMFLAACASQRAASVSPQAPIPALSYAGVLDGGQVTPIQSPVVVRYAPYPTATFERLAIYRATGIGEPIRFSERVTGTTSASSAGELIAITFDVRARTVGGNLERTAEDRASLGGTSLTLLVAPYGPIQDVKLSLPPSGSDQAVAQAVERDLRDEFTSSAPLPKTGFSQGDSVRVRQSIAAAPHGEGGSFEGKATVRGRGTYRDRPVVVFDLTGVATVGQQPFGLHSYMLLDVATGIWSHSEMIVEGMLANEKGAEQLTLRFINDVRF